MLGYEAKPQNHRGLKMETRADEGISLIQILTKIHI